MIKKEKNTNIDKRTEKEKSKKLRKPKKSGKGQKVLLIVLIVILSLIVAGLIAYGAFKNWFDNAEIGEVDTAVPWAQDSTDIIALPSGNNNSLGSNPGSIDRLKDTYNFLVVGKDNVALNTDVMMIVNLDLKDGNMSIMQLPRDTFVTFNGNVCKLNSIYSKYYNSSKASDTDGRIHDGMKGLSEFLKTNLAIHIDHYINLNLDALGEIVEAIGGVDMNVPYRMKYDDPYQNPPLHINLYPGQQTLNGDQAQQFVRYRSGYIKGDIGRQDAQKLFMTAFMESFRNNISLTNVFSVVSSILEHLTHSMTLETSAAFVREAMQLDFSNITMLTAPHTPYTYYGGSYVVLHRAALLKITNQYFNVMNVDIPDIGFDKDRNFTLTSDTAINAIYNTDKEFEGILGADEIQQNGIDIN